MKDILARELKGHNILAVERFKDSTRWMIEFVVLHPCSAYGSRGDEMRLFLAEDTQSYEECVISSLPKLIIYINSSLCPIETFCFLKERLLNASWRPKWIQPFPLALFVFLLHQ